MSGDGSSAEVEVQLYGPATQLSCVLDEGMAFTCKQKSRVYAFRTICDYSSTMLRLQILSRTFLFSCSITLHMKHCSNNYSQHRLLYHSHRCEPSTAL